MKLSSYIERNYGGSQAAFGRAMSKLLGKNITRMQVYRWVRLGRVIVVNNKMYFEKYDISTIERVESPGIIRKKG